MILASHSLTLLQHYGLPVIVTPNRFGSDTEREFEMIRERLGERGDGLTIAASRCLDRNSASA